MAPIILMVVATDTITTTITIIIRTDMDSPSLIRLMMWLSPAFPVGGFAYSGGLERAVHDDIVENARDLEEWVETLLSFGTLWNDAVLMAASWHLASTGTDEGQIDRLSGALASSSERHLEITSLGAAFLAAAEPWLGHGHVEQPDRTRAYAAAIGFVAASQKVDCALAIAAYLQAAVSQTVSAAIRLGIIGQKQGTEILAKLENTIAVTAERAAQSSLTDLGSCTIIGDIAGIRHEEQHTRLFRS